MQNSKRLESLQLEVSSLENKQADLTKTIAYKKSAEYIEERARNALNLIKPNEKVYVVQEVLGDSTETAVNQPGKTRENKSTFQLWVDLLLR